MSHRKLIVATVVVLALTALCGIGVFMGRHPAYRINSSNFARIEKGMTVEEVSRILGAPPGNHTLFEKPYSVGWAVPPIHRRPGKPATRSTSAQWSGNVGTIALRLVDGRVTLRMFCVRDGDGLCPDEEDWESGVGW